MTTALDLTEKRRLLLARLLREEGVAPQPRIPRLAAGRPARLSFGQERLWFLQEMEPESAAYNIPEVVRLSGALDGRALERAVAEILHRHAVLRTRFPSLAGRPVQVVDPLPGAPLLAVDLASLPSPVGLREAVRVAERLVHAPFVLARGPVIRGGLLRLGDEDHVLVLVVHHIASDGWSMRVLVRELTLLYAAFAAGRRSPLPDLPIQYADFAEWQRARMQGELLESQLSYWKGRLAGAATLLDLPVDRPWPATPSFRGRREVTWVSRSVSEGLRNVARRQGVTLFMTLLGALGIVLHRYTNQDDFAIGSPATNRSLPETEELIGFFVNTLALRIGLAGNPDFPAYLAQVRETVLGADAHQELPFEKLVDALELPRDLARTPLFQVMLAFQNVPSAEAQPQGLALHPFEFTSRKAQFELLFSLTDGGRWLEGGIEYRTDLFDPPTVARMARHFESLLREIARQPERRISALPLLSQPECQHLILEWNDTARAYPPGICLHQLVAAQVARTPGAPAVAFEGRGLTYDELNARANRLAHRLRALGCGPEERVGIVMERSLEMVVALLGTLKSGSAYVPLDPEYPESRLDFMLADSQPRVLLTQEHLRHRLGAYAGPVIGLGADFLADESPENPDGAPDDRSLAYVIYTSGSTGLPKGAMVHHRGIVNRLLWMQEAYRLAAGDTVLQKTPFSFDVSVWEFFLPLLSGARLVLARPGGHREGAYLVELIARERVSVIHFVPSMLQVFLEERGLAAGGCRSLRLVVCSGEALSAELERRCRARLGAGLENLYGPTEASVDVTSWTCSATGEHLSVPIGRPIANTRIHLLDPYFDPAPIGVAGELAIGGVNVGRGYLGRPSLTAERFVPDPFGEPGARLYRTGDLARHLAHGAVEFLGRIDHQVKVRGFRIELGEIEAVLAQHPALREAVVVASALRAGQRLVAYVVPLEGAVAAPDELRGYVEERLPEYMVPAVVVVLAALPLLPNGKVDRRALPAPDAPAETAAYVGPRNATEATLASLWSELLGIERIGVHDDFFALGGDSIQAVRLVSAINEELGADLRVQDVFKHPSIAGLATLLGTAPERASQAEELARGHAQIERICEAILADPRQLAKLPREREDFYPLSGIERGMMYYSLLLPEEPVYIDQYVYLVEIGAPERFFHAFDLLIGRHPVLRSTYHLYHFDQPMKVVLREVHAPREVEDLRGLPEAEQRHRILAYRRRDLDDHFRFDGDLLWRLKLFRLTGEVHALVWTCYHALLDGWSNHSLWAEMNELCSRPDLAEVTALPRLASDYKDYVALSLGRRSTARTEEFWRQLLSGHGRNKLPFNRSQLGTATGPGMRRLDVPLPAELLAGLHSLAREHKVSLRALCLSAHVYLLHVTSAEDDVLTGVVSHDRPALKDGDQVLGCFLNSVPLRLDLRGVESGLSLIRQVHAHLANFREHEILLADIAAIVGAKESADNPFFDTLFNFMNFHVVERTRDDNRIFNPMATESLVQSYGFQAEEMTNTAYDLEVSTTLGNFSARIKYAPRYFADADVERALVLYRRILEAFVRDAGARLSAEALLSPAEWSAVVHELNATATLYRAETPLHGLFEEQAERWPENTAVTCDGRSVTYRELDAWSNRLAWHLAARGVRPSQNVGLIFERSLDLVAGMLAILKCGAAYVPIEPEYPLARKLYILATSGVSLVLADRDYGLAQAAERPLTSIVPTSQDLAACPPSRPASRPRPEDLAYTIYTSGSTGNPKGVMIEHRPAMNLVQWVNREAAVDHRDTLLMVSSVCFDLSVYDVFGGLGAGARLVIAKPEDLRDPGRLLRLLAAERITFWNSVPSTLNHLVNYLEDAAPDYRQADLRMVFLSGDWIPLALPSRLWAFFPEARVVSLGGATEATVWSNSYPIGQIDESWASIPYGKPIANTSFYILNRDLEVVPEGVVGDLYIGGVGVARGYANEPEKTAWAFLPDRFADGHARMYRTGDLGRRMADGNIEFLGRADHQVKIRGFRVELGEIESQLLRHAAVRDAVVVDRVGPTGEKYLCAYIVTAAAVETAELRSHLATALPDYMIPTTFVALPELPLTANGKLDRKALPEPGVLNIASAAGFVAPEGEVETGLVAIWEEVLGVEGIGTRHDFFALGGHSLSAVQVVTHLRRRFGIELPLREVFQNPVLADLARAAEAEQGRARGPAVPPLRPREVRAEAPLSFSQQRLWFMDQLEPGNPFYNVSSAVRVVGRLDLAVLHRSLAEIVRRHEILRTVFASRNEGAVQVIQPAAPPALPFLDLRALPEVDREREARAQAKRAMLISFDLSRGPLLECRVLALGAHEHVFTLTMHHIISDGWSIGILVRELMALYGAFLRGEASPLSELPVQYADFAVWQQQWLRGEILAEQLAYWRRQLDGAPPLIHLPTDHPRPPVQGFRGDRHDFVLPAELTERLRGLSRGEDCTFFMTSLAAFHTLLHHYSGDDDVLVGAPISYRNWGEIEGLIGFFVNTLVYRTRFAGDPTFRELLARVRGVVLEAFAHQHVPFEKLVEELQPVRSPGYQPLYQVGMVLQPPGSEGVEEEGLRVHPLAHDVETTQFDLNLSMVEAPQGILCQLQYSIDLFEKVTIVWMAEQLVRLLEQVERNPDLRVSEVKALLAQADRQRWSAVKEQIGENHRQSFEKRKRRRVGALLKES